MFPVFDERGRLLQILTKEEDLALRRQLLLRTPRALTRCDLQLLASAAVGTLPLEVH
jgi:hypothetical protein